MKRAFNPFIYQQARTKPKIKAITPPPFKDCEGATAPLPDGEVLFGLPIGLRARDRIVRKHESLHANFTPSRKLQWSDNELVNQVLEDVRLHTVCQKGITRYDHRDEMAVAINEIRSLQRRVKKHGIPSSSHFNSSILCALRACGLVLCSINEAMKTFPENKASYQYRRKYPDLARWFDHILGMDHIGSRILQVAKRIKKYGGTPKRINHQTMLDAAKAIQSLFVDEDKIPEAIKEHREDGDKTSNRRKKGATPNSTTMHIARFPMENHKTRNIGRKWAYGSSGAIIRRGKLIAAAIGPVSGLFKTPKQAPGGTLLIDMSGSMELSESQISELIMSAPMATIAGYCGDNGKGRLSIIAENGKRVKSFHAIMPYTSGNEIDLPALRWLLANKAPRVFVTDIGFCSSCGHEVDQTLGLFYAALFHDKMKHCEDVDSAIEYMQTLAKGKTR